ncbi:hypothetical protein OAH18_02630 [bacterium]|nr:hypothetical protein [bacterium]
MIRGIGAQLGWSLRVDARSSHSHLLRLLFVVLLLGSVFIAWVTSLTVGAPGLALFRSICYLNIALILMGGISYFSTTVTEEKEADSLSLLKLAGMGPLSILLGKFASRLISALMLLPVQFPFTLLAITLGGCTIQQVLAAYIGMAAFLCLVATIALVASIRCTTSGTAAAVTGILVLAMFLVPFLARTVLSAAGVTAGAATDGFAGVLEYLIQFTTESSIIERLAIINQTGFDASPFSFQVMVHLVASVLLFGFAWLIFEPSTANGNVVERDVTSFNRKSALRALGIPRTWSDPFLWKDFHFVTGGKMLFIGRCIVFGLISAAIVAGHIGGRNFVDDAGRVVIWTMLGIIGFQSSIYAARIFFDEIRWNALGSLTLTSSTTGQIGRGKVLGCVLGLIPAAIFVLVGAALSPSVAWEILTEPLNWFVLLQFVTFLHFTVLLSLYFRWGALPLALVVTLVLNNCCPVLSFGFLISSTVKDASGIISLFAMVIGFSVYWLVVLFPIECEIASRLRTVAGK